MPASSWFVAPNNGHRIMPPRPPCSAIHAPNPATPPAVRDSIMPGPSNPGGGNTAITNATTTATTVAACLPVNHEPGPARSAANSWTTYRCNRHEVSSVVAAKLATNTPINATPTDVGTPTDRRKPADPSTKAATLVPNPLAPDHDGYLPSNASAPTNVVPSANVVPSEMPAPHANSTTTANAPSINIDPYPIGSASRAHDSCLLVVPDDTKQ